MFGRPAGIWDSVWGSVAKGCPVLGSTWADASSAAERPSAPANSAYRLSKLQFSSKMTTIWFSFCTPVAVGPDELAPPDSVPSVGAPASRGDAEFEPQCAASTKRTKVGLRIAIPPWVDRFEAANAGGVPTVPFQCSLC